MDEMTQRDERRPGDVTDPEAVQADAGHPSQAEGEDPAREGHHPDPVLDGHPSQAEGEDRQERADG